MNPTLRRVLDALERCGCQPRQVGPGVWVAACPSCKAEGRFGLLEIRVAADGKVDVRESPRRDN